MKSSVKHIEKNLSTPLSVIVGCYVSVLLFLALPYKNTSAQTRIDSLNNIIENSIQNYNYKKALKYARLAKKISDSVSSVENSKKIEQLKKVFETEKKEREIQLLERDNQLKELEIKQKKNERNFVLIIIVFFLFTGLLVYFRYIIKTRANKLLEEKNSELRKRNGQLQEINEKIRLQNEELEVLKEEQKKLIAMKDKFFSVIAHDLRNPFNTILGLSQLLLNSYEDFDKQKKKEFLLKIKQASEDTYRLLENLLDWAQSQSNRIVVNGSQMELLQVVNEVLTVLDTVIKSKKIKVNVDIDPDTFVFADVNMIKTVLRNLILNAVKYSYEGGEILITSKSAAEGYVEVCITDYGTGINPENVKKLFLPEMKVQTPGTTGEKGAGLGLVLCREFVEQNNGEIWVKSEKGKGSTFCFSLPRAKTVK